MFSFFQQLRVALKACIKTTLEGIFVLKGSQNYISRFSVCSDGFQQHFWQPKIFVLKGSQDYISHFSVCADVLSAFLTTLSLWYFRSKMSIVSTTLFCWIQEILAENFLVFIFLSLSNFLQCQPLLGCEKRCESIKCTCHRWLFECGCLRSFSVFLQVFHVQNCPIRRVPEL